MRNNEFELTDLFLRIVLLMFLFWIMLIVASTVAAAYFAIGG